MSSAVPPHGNESQLEFNPHPFPMSFLCAYTKLPTFPWGNGAKEIPQTLKHRFSPTQVKTPGYAGGQIPQKNTLKW